MCLSMGALNSLSVKMFEMSLKRFLFVRSPNAPLIAFKLSKAEGGGGESSMIEGVGKLGFGRRNEIRLMDLRFAKAY